MKSSQPDPLSREQTPWLFAAAVVTTLPHTLQQPWWLSAFGALLFAWAFLLWREDRRLPGRWILLALVVAGVAAILADFRTLFGREAGVATLVLFMAMKLLELRSRRDATVIVMLGYFLLLTHYFHSQDIPTGLWLLFALWVVTAALVRLQAATMPPRENLVQAGSLLAQALPFMLVLYLLFPRINGPLWGLPADAFTGQTGLSDSMAPGNIANLVRSGEIAFRVRFDEALPARQQLYWRGPVLESFDGRTWRQSTRPANPERIEELGPRIAYEMTLEAHGQRWLLALDAPVTLPAGANLDGRLAALASRPVEKRQRLRLSSSPAYRLNTAESPLSLSDNLRLPANNNPQTRELARNWQAQANDPAEVIALALRHFREEPFHYTLQPPLLGRDGIDDFLFRTRRGFCEHYAAAFVVLMRNAGIPARVVTGYQGGEMNPRDGYLVVRQSEAHAWAEVWLEQRGWIRVDPTAAVAPERIERGIVDALPAGEPLPAFLLRHGDWLHDLRHRWEALNNAWNQHILGYDTQRQRDLLSRLGFAVDWRQLVIALGLACALILALVTAWSLRQRIRPAPEIRLWHRAQRRIGIHCAPGETPLAFAARLRAADPALAARFDPVVRHFMLARYAPDNPNSLAALAAAVKRLPRRRIA
ncbi:DUF3488 and transglutaminase-like domain-containing protein [Azonexus hydrophilus]|uniref:DUF3488 and transglutaminase-like domain-containing protein n=1 Tax=Azonexus hydrophilus TaxID=418702 RepID=A0ABZ2XBL1_9RHOO